MIKKECIQCGKEFTLTDAEIEFYNYRKLSIPKRCKECRNLNKNKKQGDSASELPNRKQNANSNGKRIGLIIKFVLALLCVVGLVSWGLKRYDDNKKQYLELSLENEDKALDQGSKALDQDVGTLNQERKASDLDEKASDSDEKASDQDKNASDQNIIASDQDIIAADQEAKLYKFRTEEYCTEHYEKHGSEFGYNSIEEYVEGANRVINSSESIHKIKKEDGDDIYYLQNSNEFVLLSIDGYIRTYFKPEDGIEYYDRQ